jgi:hypothetical protein
VVNSWELDGIAEALEGTMPDLADVYRRTGNEDEYGGGPELVKVLDGVKVGIAPADFFQFQQTTAGGRQTDVTYYSMAFPRTTPIREGDLIDIYTEGVKVTAMQIERAESWDTMLRVYGEVIEDDDWFLLNLHPGGHS